jgi:hypothetical protein
MKTKMYIAFLILFTFFFSMNKMTAQIPSNLLFSKVIVYDIPAGEVLKIIVPENQVWKIESVSMGASGTAPAVFLKNDAGQNIAYFSSIISNSSANYPYWLSTKFAGAFKNNNPTYRCSISIMEFTIPK